MIRSLPAIMWLSLAAAVLAVALAFAPGSASVALATPSTDDCTGVPDEGPNFNFHAACQAHDACYATYGGGSYSAQKEALRAACDNQFLADMNASCDAALQSNQITAAGNAACKSRASLYYSGVRVLGRSFFYQTTR